MPSQQVGVHDLLVETHGSTLVLLDSTVFAAALTTRVPWRSVVHVAHHFDDSTQPLLDGADLILTVRPEPEHIGSCIKALRLPESIGDRLATMADPELLAVSRSRAVLLSYDLTAVELQLLSRAG